MKHTRLKFYSVLALALMLLLALAGTAGAQEPTPPEGCAQLTDPGAAVLTDEEVAALKADCPEPEQEAQAATASASVTLLSAGGPDAFGYSFIDSNESGGPTYNFEDISSTGTSIGLSDDQVSGAIPIGFAFDYYGINYTQIYVSSNGFLTVLPGQSSGCCQGQPMPSSGNPNGVIAGVWDDLFPPGGGSIKYQTLGSAPNRRFIVQFTDISHFCCTGYFPVTFQFKLFEGSNTVEVHYAAAPSRGTNIAAGIEDPSGTIGLQYHWSSSSLVTPLAVRYSRNVPQADPGGPYTGVEGSPVAFDGSGSSDPNGDPLQYDWDFGDGSPVAVDAGATPSHTYGDNGTYTVCVTVTDPEGNSDTQCTNAGTTTGVPVSVTFETLATSCFTGGPLQLFLNGNLIGQAYAPGNCSCTPGVGTVNIGGGTIGPYYNVGADNTWAFSKGSGQPFTAWARVTIDYGGQTEQACLFGNCQQTNLCSAGYTDSAVNASSVVPFIPSTDVTIDNVNPTVESFAATEPVPVDTEITVQAFYTDPGFLDTHTALWDWGDGTTPTAGTTTPDNGTAGDGTASGSHTYDTPGVYTVELTVTDDDGGSGQSVFQYVVVYDPSAGFVTGGGWIDSPAGAYKPDDTLAGKANFGFVSKYKKGADTPTGNTQFQFHAAGMNFHSSSYEWLVVTGGDYARFKGVGTINGEGAYKFMLWAGDGKATDGADTFRIRIWEEDEATAAETDIYDNGTDQAIGGGSIVVHTR